MSVTRVHALAAALMTMAKKASPNARSDAAFVEVRVSDLIPVLEYALEGAAGELRAAETTLALPKNIDEVCARACTVWSAQSQEDVAIGEIGELLTLFGRRAAKRDTHEEWVDEIADVIIMMHQLAFLRGRGDVSARIAEKIGRITARLDRVEAKAKAKD